MGITLSCAQLPALLSGAPEPTEEEAQADLFSPLANLPDALNGCSP
jgi:hypothetical protein